MVKTEKYNKMISDIQIDFSLAKENIDQLEIIQELIKIKSEYVMNNIALLEELEEKLRSGDAIICVKGKK